MLIDGEREYLCNDAINFDSVNIETGLRLANYTEEELVCSVHTVVYATR